MGYTTKNIPNSKAILRAWLPFKNLVGVTAVRSAKDYARAHKVIDALADEVGDDESHPLAEILDYLADQVEVYENEHIKIPEAEPRDVLRFLMAQHKLKQEDLTDCAPQSRISAFLNGKRDISKDIAKRLARRFNVRMDVFL